MDEVVGGELADVLGEVLVAVGEVDRVDAGEQLVDGRDCLGRRVATGACGSSPSRSPSKRSPTSAIVMPSSSGPRPAVLADDVVDERPHVPVGARRRQVPLIVADAVEVRCQLSTVRGAACHIHDRSTLAAPTANRRGVRRSLPDRRTTRVPSPRVLGRTLDDSYAEAIRRDITTVTTARLCVNALFRYIGPFLAVVADGLDVSVAELGVALTVAQVCGFAAPAIGRLVDHLPRRRSIALGLGGCALGGVVVATCNGIVWFTVGLLTISTFNIVLVVGTGSWIADHVPFAQRSRVVGLNEMSWALGLLSASARWASSRR